MSDSRLAKLLGMLGSDFDGERATAARMIADMAKKEGKGIAEFVMSPQTVYRDRIVYRDREPAPRARTTAYTEGSILGGLRWAQDYPIHLNAWESEFIADVLAVCYNDFDLSARQTKVARRIIAKVRGCTGEPLM